MALQDWKNGAASSRPPFSLNPQISLVKAKAQTTLQ
jgi:hypothetical protein